MANDKQGVLPASYRGYALQVQSIQGCLNSMDFQIFSVEYTTEKII
jgi:hypothetical protein